MTAHTEADIERAIQAGCKAADIHLTCTYPACACKGYPTAIRAALAAMPDGRDAALIEALTPSAETKAAYNGEFFHDVRSISDEGEEQMFTATVPWPTIKEIMAAILARALKAQPASTGSQIEPADLGLREFKPCVIEQASLGLTVMMLEDATIVWRPWGPYKGHAVDLGYNTDGRLVGIQIWDRVATLPSPPSQGSGE